MYRYDIFAPWISHDFSRSIISLKGIVPVRGLLIQEDEKRIKQKENVPSPSCYCRLLSHLEDRLQLTKTTISEGTKSP